MKVERNLKIRNLRGLHARASAKFVECVVRFDAKVSVGKDGHWVGGDSIMGLLMLSASYGTSIAVTADGVEAEACMDALSRLADTGFGEGC